MVGKVICKCVGDRGFLCECPPCYPPGPPPPGSLPWPEARWDPPYQGSCSPSALLWLEPLCLFLVTWLWFSLHGWGSSCTGWFSCTPTVTELGRGYGYLDTCFSTLELKTRDRGSSRIAYEGRREENATDNFIFRATDLQFTSIK